MVAGHEELLFAGLADDAVEEVLTVLARHDPAHRRHRMLDAVRIAPDGVGVVADVVQIVGSRGDQVQVRRLAVGEGPARAPFVHGDLVAGEGEKVRVREARMVHQQLVVGEGDDAVAMRLVVRLDLLGRQASVGHRRVAVEVGLVGVDAGSEQVVAHGFLGGTGCRRAIGLRNPMADVGDWMGAHRGAGYFSRGRSSRTAAPGRPKRTQGSTEFSWRHCTNGPGRREANSVRSGIRRFEVLIVIVIVILIVIDAKGAQALRTAPRPQAETACGKK